MAILDRKLLRDLKRSWGQLLAIAAVIACATAMVVLSQGVLHSLTETRAAYYERYRFADLFAVAKRVPLFVADRIAGIEGVRAVQTRIRAQALLRLDGIQAPARAEILSVSPTVRPRLNDLVVRQGRWISPNRPDEVMISEAFAEAGGYCPGDTLTATLNGRRRTLRIVAVVLSPEYIYAIAPGELVPDNRRYGIFYMARQALEAAYGMDGAFNDVTLALDLSAAPQTVIDQLDRLLAPYGGVGAFAREDQLSHAFLDSELQQLGALTTIVPPVFLSVAAFLLGIVTARLVQTEREQIGLMKAFGYSSRAVAWHYTKFVLAVAAAGIALGWAAGAWMGRGMTQMYGDYYRFPFLMFIVSPGVFAAAAGVSGAAALIGGLGAIRAAARLDPAVAMRPPAPPNYGGGLVGRAGRLAALTAAARMVVRHLLRRPLRAGLTCIGIAFAVALLVSSLFFNDSIEVMLSRFFFDNQRQDVSLTFTEPRPDAALSTLTALPGVLRAELYRAVPVRLTNGTQSERTSLTGRAPDADLSRLLTAAGRPKAMPPDGLALSTALADKLGVGIGDRLWVEAFSERRSTGALPVTAIVDDYIGLSAYMDRAALNRFMMEPPMASGAHLAVDPAQLDAFFAAVAAMPAVMGASRLSAALESFEEVTERSMTVMVGIYILFGSVVAIGVVYNSARLSLAERSRELASLRVLGFGKGEVAFILLGELAVLTLLALPLGCWIGYQVAALMAGMFGSDLFRLPMVIAPSTYGLAALVVLIAVIFSGAAVAWRVSRLDLVAVLKTRD